MHARELIQQLPGSRIREVANAAIGRSDVLAFWFGEGDEATPALIRNAAADSLARGETFYSHNLGLAELREAVARYTSSLHSPVAPGRVAVTSSGVSALMLAQQALLGAGDTVVAVVPLWPNLTAQATILGAQVHRVSLHPHAGPGALAWRLDLEQLLAAVTPRTRVLLLNAPNNPTGWTLRRDEQQALLDHCRRTGTWIVADEVYERLFYPEDGAAASPGLPGRPPCAPSFLDLADPQDRLIVVQSFSKTFQMTGWRLGWMVVPEGLADGMAKLIEFNTSCAPVFVQRAGLAALEAADQLVPPMVAHLRRCRDTLTGALRQVPAVQVSDPAGGMYVFLRVPGQGDSLAAARRLVAEAGLGLAPGVAFGPEGEGWLRWCFASRDPQRLVQGAQRLAGALGMGRQGPAGAAA